MINNYPDYPRDASGEIPEPLCYDEIKVDEEVGCAYLWDMNGCSISVSSITGKENEPLDDQLLEWAEAHELIGTEEVSELMAQGKWRNLYKEGLELSKQVYEYLGRKHTVYYRSHCFEAVK